MSDHKTKLASLVESEGYETLDAILEEIVSDNISPGICMNGGCGYTCEVEPDQDAGWCEECRTNSVKSALVLAGLI
jgi:hypothetical protein